MARLTECDRCGSLATLETVRELYGEGPSSASDKVNQTLTIEEDIVCPVCGLRTQVLDSSEDCAV
ncbi:MAG TPA: hypothetical protein VF175_11665 [Lacipirellula sp.]